MSLRGSLALMPRTRRSFVLFWTAILIMTLAFQYAAAATPGSALATGQKVTICHATNSETNPYTNPTVDISSSGHLHGGHDTEHNGPIWYPGAKADGVTWGDIIPPYTFQPDEGPLFVYPGKNWPEGEALLKDDCQPKLAMKVAKGVSLSADGPFVPSLTTTVGTTVHYRITITNTGNLALSGVTLSDNKFNLVAKGCTVPTTLAVGAHYDCNYSATAVAGTTTNIATGDTAQTGPDTGTATVVAYPPPAPALTVDKGVSLNADGPFAASLTTTTGTTVHYRITVTNTGNVTLHGVTLSDNKFDLVAKGCTIPTTLAAGAHFDCNYTDTAATGTKTNIATGDSTETDSDTGTATVTANPVPAPALTVDKGVSLTADGPFEASLTTTAGTTVHYRVRITNTGNTNLTGVTLTDNTFNLVTKGCTIPTTLAVGAHFDCDYTDVAALGTTTNIATGDSAETDSDTGTATVTATPPPAPALTVDKGVSLTADGSFGASLTTTTGTTVYYRITITNTGNVPLTGVTLGDNTFDLVAKGCVVPTTLAVGAHFDCNYSTSATTGTTTNIAIGDSDQTPSDTGTATVTANPAPAPGLRVRKAVGLSADGPFINILTVAPGTTVHYRITVTNTGNVALTGVTLSDNTFDLVAKGCTIPTTLAVGASFDCDYSSVSAETSTVNTATADSDQTPPDSDNATVNPSAQQNTPVVAIAKSNNAPAAPDGAKSGDTVTYILDYTITDGPADNATIEDVLPAGVTYVTGSATDSENGEFVFAGYDSGTRTLTWTAVQLSENDSVSYKVTVDAGAAGIHQPLVNEACIVATGAAGACAESDVFVAGAVEAETDTPSVPTAPQTDVLASGGTQAPGLNMGLVLLFLGVVTFVVAFVTPMPASARNRIRRR